MNIRQAKLEDKKKMLQALDEFNDFANSLDNSWDGSHSTFSRKNSGELFDEIIDSEKSLLLIAENDGKVVGFLEIHKVPRLRKAKYYGEIESMFVQEKFRGTGVAKQLMDAAKTWARQEHLECIRLYSGHELLRAHSFYEKMRFKHAGRTYKFSEPQAFVVKVTQT